MQLQTTAQFRVEENCSCYWYQFWAFQTAARFQEVAFQEEYMEYLLVFVVLVSLQGYLG